MEPYTHDIIVLADLAREGDAGLRIRRELQSFHAAGYRCGLYHIATSGRAVLPDALRSIREGLADPIARDAVVHAKLVIVHSPGLLKDLATGLARMTADRVVLVVDRAPNLNQIGRWFSFGFGPMTWVPTNRWVRSKLEDLNCPVPVDPQDWRSVAGVCRPRPEDAPPRDRPVIGRVSALGDAQWPQSGAEMAQITPRTAAFDAWTLGAPPEKLAADCPQLEKWTVLKGDDISVERFLELIDVFMYYPGTTAPELPEAAIATAMASGKLVVLPPHLRAHFGPGAIYAEPKAALAALTAVMQDETQMAALHDVARRHSALLFSERTLIDRIKAQIGPPGLAAPAVQAGRAAARKRALFVPSNGVGLGHAARLLAIARRLDDTVEPVFASLGQVSSIIESFGYLAEYIPSYSDIGATVADWDEWFRYEFAAVIRRHQPDVVVYDGNHPTSGLVRAALAHGACRLVWVRRGMCPPRPSPYLGNARFFDCVIEPGEYAAERDMGPTAALKGQVVPVSPVRLLDADELLPRADAMHALGLDPERPAVLLQLGAGGNRDIVNLTDTVVGQLRRFETLQIVIAEWTNGTTRLPPWPGTRLLRGFPISRYFNAFDLSISAAGYNTFHEVIGFGLPTVFLANRHPSMDDQGGRAQYAQEHGAAFDVTEEEMHLLPTVCEALLNRQANALVRENCRKFDQTNGAAQAALVIKRLLGAT